MYFYYFKLLHLELSSNILNPILLYANDVSLYKDAWSKKNGRIFFEDKINQRRFFQEYEPKLDNLLKALLNWLIEKVDIRKSTSNEQSTQGLIMHAYERLAAA